MKAFSRGLLAAFTGFMMIMFLVGGVYGLIGVWFLDGYAAVTAFLGSILVLACDVYVLRRVGKDGKYAKDNV